MRHNQEDGHEDAAWEKVPEHLHLLHMGLSSSSNFNNYIFECSSESNPTTTRTEGVLGEQRPEK